ncbi:hypothetical protein LP7551_04564 [Roseibium album]|nr:hypothetical protein LP7551_04564 [Roseibium album]
MLEAQAPFWNQMASSVNLTGNPDMTSTAEELWSEARSQGLKATQEWLKLREASAKYRTVTAKAWGRAFQRLIKEVIDQPDLWKSGTRAVTNRW